MMTTENPENPPEQAPEPPSSDTPQWVKRLEQKLDNLANSLSGNKNVTDEDRSSIAQGVFDLFERGGAFKEETTKEGEQETTTEETTETGEQPATPPETPPKKHGRFSSFAQRFEGS